jgi:hypothetical protein
MLLGEYVVEATRLCAAAAVNEPKAAPTIKNAVVLDEISDHGEYLKYIPDMSIIYSPHSPEQVGSAAGLRPASCS